MDEHTFHTLLAKGAQYKASDVLLKVGQPPAFRVGGKLHYMQADKLKPAQTAELAKHVMRKTRYAGELADLQEYDTAYSVAQVGRFRVNVYRQRGTLALALRAIPPVIPDFNQLGLPEAVRNLAQLERGLVLVVGAAGNGKSSTLAALVGQMNQTRRLHIVTVEDPIEFLHSDQLSSVSQREVGLDTQDFPTALRAALRQDPDVILVGEIRDEITMDIALKASETGHLVLSTLHTPDVTRTVGRVLSLSGHMDPQETRERLSDNLRAVVAQRLLPREGGSMCLACEVLIATGSARESIRRPDTSVPLKDVMERGAHPYGMQTFEMHIRALVKAGILNVDVARQALG